MPRVSEKKSRKLDEYNKKRDFTKTSEPAGKPADEKPSKRFVIHLHNARRLHYDLRLEWQGVLLSWAVPKGPSFNPSNKRLAVHVEDHPYDYKDFEGTIAKGEYGAGPVMIWDEGTWEPAHENVDAGLEGGSMKFRLFGQRMKGNWALVHLKAAQSGDDDNWLLIKEKDEYVSKEDGISQYMTSVRTGRTFEQIEKDSARENSEEISATIKETESSVSAHGTTAATGGTTSGRQSEMPQAKVAGRPIDPYAGAVEKEEQHKNLPFRDSTVQLPKLVQAVPEGKEWIYELKYDGYRILAFIENEKVRLATRNGQDYTVKFKPVADSLLEWAGERKMVLDGEVVVFNEDGKSDFGNLQNFLENGAKTMLYYIVFDILAAAGKDLRGEKLVDRKAILEKILVNAPENLQFSNHAPWTGSGSGNEIFKSACRAGFEGIVCKKTDSTYKAMRTSDWVKVKCQNMQEFVIGGYLHSDRTSGLRSIMIGYYDNGKLVYAGNVGTGFSDKTMKMLLDEFAKIEIDESPFTGSPELKKKKEMTWLKPVLIAEVKFAEWTSYGILRQASFKGLRTDKDPKEIFREGQAAWQES